MGIVTTTRVQHASPGGNYAHIVERDWYSDDRLSSSAAAGNCTDIAYQLVHNTDINVRSLVSSPISVWRCSVIFNSDSSMWFLTLNDSL